MTNLEDIKRDRYDNLLDEIKEKDVLWSVGDWEDMDSNLMKQLIGFSMKPNNLVAFLFDFETCASFKPKGIRCSLISLELKHGDDGRATPKDFVNCAMNNRDVFTWIVKLELQ